MAGNLFVPLGISLLLGLLVGLQRERTESSVAGIRTFPLIAAFGTLSAWLAERHGGWILAAGIVALAGLLLTGNLARSQGGDRVAGQTTEVAALLMYGVGAWLVVGEPAVAVALGGAMALLLHLKEPMHAFADRIDERDIRAIMQFVLVTLVILPILPDQAYGPYEVLNPFQIWLMVVLIVAIGLGGYVAYQLFGARAGSVLGGVLGGLISSTATTVSFARRELSRAEGAPLAALVIVIAAACVYVRVLVEVAIVAPLQFAQIAPPLAAMLVACAAIAVVLYRGNARPASGLPRRGNPASLALALAFGAVYAIVLLAIAAARDEFGVRGLYAVALVSGLVDMDAITLSTAELVRQERLDPGTGWRLILWASLSNLVFKGGLVAAFGDRELLRRVAAAFGVALLAGGVILWAWP